MWDLVGNLRRPVFSERGSYDSHENDDGVHNDVDDKVMMMILLSCNVS